MMKMNVFENLIDRIERKLAFGSTKQKTFMYHVKTLLKGDEIDPQIIWRGLEGFDGVQNAQLYCELMFNGLYSQEMKQKNYIINQQQMLATLLPLKFYKVKQEKKLQLSLNQQIIGQQRILGHSKWVISYFQEKVDFFSIINRFVFAPKKLQKNQQPINQILSQMNECKQYCKILRNNRQYLQHNYKKLKKVSYPKLSQIQTRTLTYGYICLIDYIKSKSSTLTLQQYKNLINLLQCFMYPTQQKLTSYLPLIIHLISSFITFYGCQYDQILKKFLSLSVQLRIMPQQIGKLGEQLFNQLLKQTKVPGYAFRKKLRDYFPDIDYKQAIFSNKQYYFITNSINFLYDSQKVSLNILRKKIVIHLLKISGFSQKQISAIQKYLDNVKEDQVFTLYEKSLKICQISCEVDSFQRSKTILKESLEKLMLNQTKSGNQRIIKKQNYLDIESKMPIRLKQSIFREITLENKKQHPLHIFQFPLQVINHISLSQFLDLKSKKSLQFLISKAKTNFPQKNYFCSKNKLPLIFYGNNIQFFRFIQPLGRYLQFKTVDKLMGFKIYYIPKKSKFRQNYLSYYMGCYDILYQRVIINCFGERAIYPYIQPNQKNKNLLPIQLMNKNLNCYIKQAQNVFPLNLFKCTIGKIGLNYNKFQQNYYFCESVSLGLFAQAEIIRINKTLQNNKQKYSLRELPDVINHKLKDYQPLVVLIQIQRFEKLECKTTYHKQKMIIVDDIQICNIPKSYFIGKKPQPSNQFLQVTILPTTNGKVFKKQLFNSYNFKQKRQNIQIYQAFKDLFIECTVKSIRIQNLKKQSPLRIVIDGQIMEGIDHIEIEAATSIDKRILTLPIQTFIPIK